jgi:hypothetical protein
VTDKLSAWARGEVRLLPEELTFFSNAPYYIEPQIARLPEPYRKLVPGWQEEIAGKTEDVMTATVRSIGPESVQARAPSKTRMTAMRQVEEQKQRIMDRLLNGEITQEEAGKLIGSIDRKVRMARKHRSIHKSAEAMRRRNNSVGAHGHIRMDQASSSEMIRGAVDPLGDTIPGTVI